MEGEHLLPPVRDKTKGVFLAYRAASYLDLQEPEPALLPRFAPYARAQGVPELFHLAAA
ncbi:hypothetical protein ABZT06_45825 [Streptomyces sp. NPDC005483]|uniref:hypothetical protein n=1 Tax=Streptomyces sp. NPDC005483 TaxID=3154882 RepID=UPI0033A247FD